MGYSDGGRTRAISEDHWFQAGVPQKSSTHRNPPFKRYSRNRPTSWPSKPMVPTSDVITKGQVKSAGSVSRTTQ